MIINFLDIFFDKIINQSSSQSKEFFYYRPPTFEMIVKANSILTSEPNPFTNGEINVFWIRINADGFFGIDKPGSSISIKI